NIVFGDSGEILSAFTVNGTPNLAAPLDGHLITLGQLGTTDPLFGGADTITTGTGRDIILGGPANDTITANAGESASQPDGNNIVFGDQGYIDYVTYDHDPRDIGVISSGDLLPLGGGITGANDTSSAANSVDINTGGPDTITTGVGSDIIIGGPYADTINSG